MKKTVNIALFIFIGTSIIARQAICQGTKEGQRLHVVKRGDNFKKLFADYSVTAKEIIAANSPDKFGYSCVNPTERIMPDGKTIVHCRRVYHWLRPGKTIVIPASPKVLQKERDVLKAANEKLQQENTDLLLKLLEEREKNEKLLQNKQEVGPQNFARNSEFESSAKKLLTAILVICILTLLINLFKKSKVRPTVDYMASVIMAHEDLIKERKEFEAIKQKEAEQLIQKKQELAKLEKETADKERIFKELREEKQELQEWKEKIQKEWEELRKNKDALLEKEVYLDKKEKEIKENEERIEQGLHKRQEEIDKHEIDLAQREEEFRQEQKEQSILWLKLNEKEKSLNKLASELEEREKDLKQREGLLNKLQDKINLKEATCEIKELELARREKKLAELEEKFQPISEEFKQRKAKKVSPSEPARFLDSESVEEVDNDESVTSEIEPEGQRIQTLPDSELSRKEDAELPDLSDAVRMEQSSAKLEVICPVCRIKILMGDLDAHMGARHSEPEKKEI